MPQIHPLSLYCPSTKTLEQTRVKGVKGPTVFVDIIAKAENHSAISNGIKNLIKNKDYLHLSAGLYWWRIKNKQGCFEGLLTGVLAEGNTQNITTHEAVLEQRVKLLSDYLNTVGFQAEPVLLMHENSLAAAKLAKRINNRKEDFLYLLGTEQHQLWCLKPEEVTFINNFCQELDQFHLADGHHRYASTLNLEKKEHNPSLLFSFLVAKDQLRNLAFSWAIKDPLWADRLLQNIPPESICDRAEANIEIKAKNHSIYCHVTKEWTVVDFIVEKLLAVTAQQKLDLKSLIDYYPPGGLSPAKAKAYPVVIDYTPLSLEEMITLAKAQKNLPPKSTYILPKLPTGLCFTPLDKGQIK